MRNNDGFGAELKGFGAEYEHNKGVSIDGFLNGLSTNAGFQNLAGELIKPGKEPEELLMRTIFASDKQMNAILRFIDKGKRYNLGQEHEDIARRWLAAQASRGGLGRRELAMVLTGVIAPQLWGLKASKGGLRPPIRSSNDNQVK